jgi:hypothetical protein
VRIERGFAAWIDFSGFGKWVYVRAEARTLQVIDGFRGRSCLGSDEPGLKALYSCACFRGLKPSAPSGVALDSLRIVFFRKL